VTGGGEAAGGNERSPGFKGTDLLRPQGCGPLPSPLRARWNTFPCPLLLLLLLPLPRCAPTCRCSAAAASRAPKRWRCSALRLGGEYVPACAV